MAPHERFQYRPERNPLDEDKWWERMLTRLQRILAKERPSDGDDRHRRD